MSGSSASDFGVMKFALPFGVFQTRSRAPSGRGNPPGVHRRALESWKMAGHVLAMAPPTRESSATPPSDGTFGFGGSAPLAMPATIAGSERSSGLAGSAAPREPGMLAVLASLQNARSPPP